MKKLIIIGLLLLSFEASSKSWPVRVIWVKVNIDKNIPALYQVMTDRGIMYYTDTKPIVGQIAFCLSDSDEIVTCSCEK